MNDLSKAGAIAAGIAGSISVIGAVVSGIIIILYKKDQNRRANDRGIY